MLALHSGNPSLNPADAYSFSVKFVFEKNENKQKEAGICLFIIKFPKAKYFVWLRIFFVCMSFSSNKSLSNKSFHKKDKAEVH